VNRKVVLVTSGLAVALLAAWFLALWQPKGAELSEERERAAAAEDQASQLATRIRTLEAAKANGPALAAARDRLRSAVPESPNLAQFILDANDAATTSGVSFVSISPREPAPSQQAGLPPEIGLSVDIEGGYFQVLDFVEKLSDLQRVVVIDGVSVSPLGTEGTAPPELKVALTGRMFTTELPGVAVPLTDPTSATSAEQADTPTTTTVVPS